VSYRILRQDFRSVHDEIQPQLPQDTPEVIPPILHSYPWYGA